MQRIFIAGIDRSGTTALAVQLARWFGCVALPEAQFKRHLVNPENVDLFRLRSDFRFKLWEVPWDPNLSDHLTGIEVYDEITRTLLKKHKIDGTNAPIVDHTPDNSVLATKLLDDWNPSLFIHIVRDPRAVVASILRTDWLMPHVGAALDFWFRKNVAADALLMQPSSRVLLVRYEDLCARPLLVANEVVSRLIPTSARSESGWILLPNYTAQQHKRILDPLNDKEGWRQTLTRREAEFIEGAVSRTKIGQLYKFRPISVELNPFQEFARASRWPVDWCKAYSRRRRRGISAIPVADGRLD